MRALPPLPEICGSGVPPIVPRTETNVNACGQKVLAPVYKAGTHFRRFCPPLRRERPRRETGRPVPKNRAIPANLYRLHKDEALALEEMTRKRQKKCRFRHRDSSLLYTRKNLPRPPGPVPAALRPAWYGVFSKSNKKLPEKLDANSKMFPTQRHKTVI